MIITKIGDVEELESSKSIKFGGQSNIITQEKFGEFKFDFGNCEKYWENRLIKCNNVALNYNLSIIDLIKAEPDIIFDQTIIDLKCYAKNFGIIPAEWHYQIMSYATLCEIRNIKPTKVQFIEPTKALSYTLSISEWTCAYNYLKFINNGHDFKVSQY